MILMSLFSVFDPISFLGLKLNWVVVCFVFLFSFVWVNYYVMGGLRQFDNVMVGYIADNYSKIAQQNSLGLVVTSLFIFMFLLILNVMSLFPFVFTITAHPVFTIGVGLVFWVSFFIMGFYSHFGNSLAHLVPMGCPIGLAPFMVLIESVSHMIRPFTLAIRLSANMMAGHLIIGLLASISLNSYLSFLSSIIFQNVIMILEFGVAFIQSFVFSILLLLYVLDYY